MTPEQMDALALAVMDSIEPRYQHDITIFARRYRKALAEKMEPVATLRKNADYNAIQSLPWTPKEHWHPSWEVIPLYSLEDWKK